MLETMSNNREIIEDDINLLVYHMNGGLDYDDAWMLTVDQRAKLIQMLEKIFKAQSGDQ